MSYDIKELKYYHEIEAHRHERSEYIFKDEYTASVQEKIAFVNEHNDNLYDNIIKLINMYQKALESGEIKTNPNSGIPRSPYSTSLKKFYKTANERMGLDFPRKYIYSYEKFECFSFGWERNGNRFSLLSLGYKCDDEEKERLVKAMFHMTLINLANEERQYFLSTDAYSVARKKVMEHDMFRTVCMFSLPQKGANENDINRDDHYGIVWGNDISFGNFKNHHRASLEELNALLEVMDEVEEFAKKKTKAFLKKSQKGEL